MAPEGPRAEAGMVEDADLCRYLAALSVPNRLALLRKLQLPHALGDIELAAVRSRGSLRPARALSRTAVQEHVGKLQELGLVQARASVRDGRRVSEYVVNHARLFLMVEELRRLSLIRPVQAAEATAADGTGDGAAPLPEGLALVLVGGPREGTAFALDGPGPWRIGRDPEAEVSLPYDPFVSMVNSRVVAADGAVWVEDLPGNRNGTSVNWRPVAPGGRAPLEAGDVLGAGRSLLVVRGVRRP